ncbi:Putative alcohol dehydrogenase, iron-type/glycerol dehydrogenase GldA [Septoria linicola]|uniref:Alcohol dehydrogenase, iron-type/glycerol dehydrogenase GldA n=1 Tax=Septoria linicola TaxID=215465 RepID=A0A9Q9AZR5_9PEZI|nr:putative alcohol dehydrogenase, iron-type/glycerol dehydrogenase GldA [Septoria linicola]USW54711.1 Putative alcohol dehydrogenase, iron-type/glycerol dehydrogenase GldA [Septoria linicola]
MSNINDAVSTASIESSQSPLKGLWKPTHLQRLHYGSNSVQEYLLECLPNEKSKAFILTGNSLATKTPLIKQIEELLGNKHAATFSKIGQHAPIKQLDEATELVLNDPTIDTIISVGGGSPIDSAKAISYRLNEKQQQQKGGEKKWLYHITIPTTLSAAECTLGAGYTNEDGMKTGVAHPELAPHVIIYDSKFALETPEWLFKSTGLRALDHAMELMYHPTSTEMPARQNCLLSAQGLFEGLREYSKSPKDEQVITKLQLAAFQSLGFLALNVKGGLGLSHTLGYALGSPFQIPHGITSCLTLGHVVKLKAESSEEDAKQLARMAPFVSVSKSGDAKKDGVAVGDAILKLVEEIGLKTTLTEKGVGKDKVDWIVKTATRQDSGPVYDKVKQLVEALY